MAIAHVRKVLLELGYEDVPERLVSSSLGMSLWVSLPIADLAGRNPKQLVADFPLRAILVPRVTGGRDTTIAPHFGSGSWTAWLLALRRLPARPPDPDQPAREVPREQ